MAIEQAVPKKEIPNENRRRSYVPIPITDAMRPIALAIIAKGGIEYEEMKDVLRTEYKVDISVDDLRRLADTESKLIGELRRKIRKATEAEASKMLKKVDRILDRTLDRTLKDMEKLDELDLLFANGKMETDEYNQATSKLKIMPLNDVIKIAEHLSPKPPAGRGAAVALTPPSNSESTPELPVGDMSELGAELAAAIARGDAVELQRIMYKGKKTDDTQS